MNLRPCLFVLLAGCSSSSPPASASDAETPGQDATGPSDGDSQDAGTDANPTCNTIANTAPVVQVTQIAADPPTPQGGTILSGTYWGTSLDIYTGPSGPAGTTGTWQATALIAGETVQLVNSGQPLRRTITLTTADAGFASVDTCPDSQMAQGGYTATPTMLVIFLDGGTDDAGARTVVETLTRQ